MARTWRLVALVSTLALALAACGGGRAATPAPAAQQVLEGSSRAMSEVSAFRFTLENEGGETPLPGGLGLGLRSARGVMVRPDGLRAEIKATTSGFLVEVKVISLGERTYVSNPITGAWQTYERGVSPVAFFDPARGVGLILQSMESPSVAGEGTADGVAAHRVKGRLPAQAAQFIAGSYAEGSVLDAELFIGKSDLLLRRARLAGRITSAEPDGIVRVLTFSEFNQAVTIEPPV